MKKLLSAFKSFKSAKGFTLIELLVVIGILGILAASLVATIDPFEQLKKANDANVKNTAVEFVDASIRYYTTHNSLPWSNTGNGLSNCTTSANPAGADLTGTQMTSCLSDLVANGELQAGFTGVTSIIDAIYVSGTTNTVTACFIPQSKSEQQDPDTKYTTAGLTASGCTSQNPSTGTSCAWCAQ